MNHGYCINCWWYKAFERRHYVVANSGLKENFGHGRCYMRCGDGDFVSKVNGDSYCPDYYNRKHGDKEMKMTLEEYIESLNKKQL